MLWRFFLSSLLPTVAIGALAIHFLTQYAAQLEASWSQLAQLQANPSAVERPAEQLLEAAPADDGLQRLRNEVICIRRLIIFGLVAASLITLVLAFILDCQLSGAFSMLTENIETITSGNYSLRIPQQRFLETEAVAERFRKMARMVYERERIFRDLAAAMAVSTGNEWLERTVEDLRRMLGADEVCIRRLSREGRLEVITAAGSRGGCENILCNCNDGPCALTLKHGFYHCVTGLDICFSSCRALCKECFKSYTGIVLGEDHAKPFGVIAVLSRRPPAHLPVTQELLTIVSARVSAELRRQEFEEARQQLEEQLRQSLKMEALGRLAGGVAHDFNNILQVISGYASLLVDRADRSNEDLDIINEILIASERAAAMVRQLLLFSRKAEACRHSIDLNDLVRNLSKMLHRLLGEQVELKVSAEACLPPIVGDPAQIEQVLLNLCVNARDAMPQGGIIRVATTLVSAPKGMGIQHPESRDGDYILLEVSDTGIGMSEDVKRQMFDPFFTTKEVGKGTGLGLAMVYAIVENHGGFIEVDTRKGHGTAVRVYWPAAWGSAVRGEVVEAVEAVEAEEMIRFDGRGRILLAEDEVSVRNLVSLVLQRKGFDLFLARDGAEALDLFQREQGRFDLVILDMVMPHMGGREVAEAIRRTGNRVPILFCSGYSDGEITVEDHTGARTAMIRKPFKLYEIFSMIRILLRGEPEIKSASHKSTC